jgi:hypothetical protein
MLENVLAIGTCRAENSWSGRPYRYRGMNANGAEHRSRQFVLRETDYLIGCKLGCYSNPKLCGEGLKLNESGI